MMPKNSPPGPPRKHQGLRPLDPRSFYVGGQAPRNLTQAFGDTVLSTELTVDPPKLRGLWGGGGAAKARELLTNEPPGCYKVQPGGFLTYGRTAWGEIQWEGCRSTPPLVGGGGIPKGGRIETPSLWWFLGGLGGHSCHSRMALQGLSATVAENKNHMHYTCEKHTKRKKMHIISMQGGI